MRLRIDEFQIGKEMFDAKGESCKTIGYPLMDYNNIKRLRSDIASLFQLYSIEYHEYRGSIVM